MIFLIFPFSTIVFLFLCKEAFINDNAQLIFKTVAIVLITSQIY